MNGIPDSGADTAAADGASLDVAEVPTEIASLPTWVLLALAAIGFTALWLVSFDNGLLTSVIDSSGSYLHEFFHDSRHVLGVPCH